MRSSPNVAALALQARAATFGEERAELEQLHLERNGDISVRGRNYGNVTQTFQK